eukprot:1138535-Pelagomonas_calceolata.AAC.6
MIWGSCVLSGLSLHCGYLAHLVGTGGGKYGERKTLILSAMMSGNDRGRSTNSNAQDTGVEPQQAQGASHGTWWALMLALSWQPMKLLKQHPHLKAGKGAAMALADSPLITLTAMKQLSWKSRKAT